MKYERYLLQRLVHRYQKKMMEKEDVTVCRSLCKVAVTVGFFFFFACVINTGQCVGFHMLLNKYCFIDSWMCICQ